MRLIDMSTMDVASAGVPWTHAMSPCSKQAIHLLERNAKVVTWLTPRGSDETHEQIPCIMFKGKHFSLSLRMQKAIYRHVRLKKGFKNEESVNGFPKLRIPDLLLKEKIRTQSRFDVSTTNNSIALSIKAFNVLNRFSIHETAGDALQPSAKDPRTLQERQHGRVQDEASGRQDDSAPTGQRRTP
jgi:hypothetical protein